MPRRSPQSLLSGVNIETCRRSRPARCPGLPSRTENGSDRVRNGISQFRLVRSEISLNTLPFLIPNLDLALVVAYVVVAIKHVAIASIRFKYFHIPFARSSIQVIVGGALVFAAGVLIGSS
jgi:hypothetical protein